MTDEVLPRPKSLTSLFSSKQLCTPTLRGELTFSNRKIRQKLGRFLYGNGCGLTRKLQVKNSKRQVDR